MSVLKKILRAGEGKRVRDLTALVGPINEMESTMAALSDEELAGKTAEFRERLANGETLDDLLIEAFAVVREASRRVLGQRHYDVQLMGGMALHFGWIAEMKTGEGKTLVSTLPVYLNALAGKGVHVVTANDYLATRDAAWMGQVHRFLGLSVGRVGPDLPYYEQKVEAYNSDVTYGTNTEFGFDYLRDNMAGRREYMAQRGHHYAIVDEVDSILIDEARTPLIISGPSDQSQDLYRRMASVVAGLSRETDYEIDEEKKVVLVSEAGVAAVERALGVENLYDEVSSDLVHHLEQALRAKELYLRDRDYLVADGEVKIVDEFTGRTLEGRRWSDGLHQAVEAKERVAIQDENHTWATVTLQNYFRLYEKLAGMTGTAETEAGEFSSTYGLSVVPIPTNRPNVRVDAPDLVYATEQAKVQAIVEEVRERTGRGQPILLGTISVEKSEMISRALSKAGVAHEVLNAKQHFREAEIVAQAGRSGAVTVATNMAGRGVDILLGGNPEALAKREAQIAAEEGTPEHEQAYEKALAKWNADCSADGEVVRAAGGLYVLGTERHDSRRIDNQLRGRSGRQGDPGETRFYLSLEDELMRVFATGAASWALSRAVSDDAPLEAGVVTKSIERAQTAVEGRNAESRRDVLKYDEVINKQRLVLYARRREIMDDEDIHAETRQLIDERVGAAVERLAEGEYPESWDLDGLVSGLRVYYPIRLDTTKLGEADARPELVEMVVDDALSLYEEKCEKLPGGLNEAAETERTVFLSLLDARWREHLAEMDYLREGIHLRQVAQKDPLAEWQREGFARFSAMMEGAADDFVRYITHVEHAAAPADQNAGAVTNAQTDASARRPVTKSTTGRNQPCHRGSGKKYKMCHGRGR